MNRRELIQRVSLMLGGVISAPIMAGAMGQALNTEAGITASVGQEKLLAEIADITRVVRDCFTKEEQTKFYDGLAKLEADSKKKFGKSFVKLSLAQKNGMVKEATVSNKEFFKEMKALTITGFFTSEIGATQALAYDFIPGKFDGCTPLQKGQKTWAL
jgi:hypothetical protein